MTKHLSYHQDRKRIRKLAVEDYYELLSIIVPSTGIKKFTPKQARSMVAQKRRISERTLYRAKAKSG